MIIYDINDLLDFRYYYIKINKRQSEFGIYTLTFIIFYFNLLKLFI